MSTMKCVVPFWVCLIVSALGREGFGPTDQEWGYVTVRDGAHMFWWLHYTTASQDPTQKPILVWLQGGPGSSSTGYGNFAEIGPLDSDLNPRNHSWTNVANLLLVDNPVGTGYSYTDSVGQLTTTNQQIADDFVELLKGFLEELPEFKTTPLYIFSESYGGKMTADIGLTLYKSIKNGYIESNFKGVGLGDSWISPIDSVLTWGPYLLQIGAVDQEGFEDIDEVAQQTQKALDNGQYEAATDLFFNLEMVVMLASEFVDFYNVLTKIPASSKFNLRNGLAKPATDDEDAKIDVLMNGPVKKALNINVTWGAQSGDVFGKLSEDFMKPVTATVEELLNTTDIKVAVYNGQLDLIVDTPGTLDWVDRLSWTKSSAWPTTYREAFGVDGIYEGYEKKLGNFSMYWVNRAGHMVPADNPAAMKYILQDVTNNFEV